VDSAELIARSEPIADASLPDMRARRRPGTAIAAMMPMIATTISSSMRVKPLGSRIFISLLSFEQFEDHEPTGGLCRALWATRAQQLSNRGAKAFQHAALRLSHFHSSSYRRSRKGNGRQSRESDNTRHHYTPENVRPQMTTGRQAQPDVPSV